MLSREDLDCLDAACIVVSLSAHQPRRVLHEELGLTLAFAEDRGYLKVTLRGQRRAQFTDWHNACAERTEPPNRPRTDRSDPALGDRIIFRVKRD